MRLDAPGNKTTIDCMIDQDLGLTQRIARGDEEAFNELVARFKKNVFSIIYRYLGSCPDAEDLAQDVFIKIWRHAGGFKGKSSLSTWIYRIVANHCLNYRKKRKQNLASELDEQIPAPGSCHEKEYLKSRTAKILLDALDGLPPRQRMALILSRFEERSYKEIAEILGISLSSVEGLISRARENLKEKLRPLREKGEI